MALPQFATEAEAPERGYRKLKCKGFFEWIGGKFVDHPCGRVVWAPRQASMCTACARAARAAHMRAVRAKRPPTVFGKCPVCGVSLKFSGAERSTRQYCSNEHRQSAYRDRLKARKSRRRGR